MDTTHSPKPLEGTSLIVIDMQAKILEIMPDANALSKRIAFAIQAANLLGASIYYTEQVPDKLGHTDGPLLHALNDSPQVFTKTSFSALKVSNLAKQLTQDKIKSLLLTGIELPICVYQTAIDALTQDYQVTLLSDCTTGRRSQDLSPAIAALRNAGCSILPSETVFYSALGDTQHPLFRALNQLVKGA
jgi:nicotinamidase-related amidase